MAKGPLKVLAYSQDDKTELDQGTLELIDNQILQTTGTIRLRPIFPTRAVLWPGELVNARLLLETRHNGLTIPPGAVQQGPNGSYVYVIAPDERRSFARSRWIRSPRACRDPFRRSGERTVVVDGQYGLQPGSLVNVLHGKAAREANLQSSVEQAIP